MAEVKRGRGRPRKTPTVEEMAKPTKVEPKQLTKKVTLEIIELVIPEIVPTIDILNAVDEVITQEEKETLEFILELRETKKQEWDYKIGDPIEFFDTRYSYEITGYKPINATQGLDFDPSWFTEARDTYKRTGHYCLYPRGIKAYAEFWTEEYRRCRDGLTVNGYTVTGDHYFFLNYYQLLNTASTTKAGEGRSIDFPSFSVSLYEYLHYVELAKRLRLHVVLMKARGLKYQSR